MAKKVKEVKAEKMTKVTLDTDCYVNDKACKKGDKVEVDSATKKRLQDANCIARNRMMTT